MKLEVVMGVTVSGGGGGSLRRSGLSRYWASRRTTTVARCRLTASQPVCKVLLVCLKLQYVEILSRFAFNFNLRRYIMASCWKATCRVRCRT